MDGGGGGAEQFLVNSTSLGWMDVSQTLPALPYKRIHSIMLLLQHSTCSICSAIPPENHRKITAWYGSYVAAVDAIRKMDTV